MLTLFLIIVAFGLLYFGLRRSKPRELNTIQEKDYVLKRNPNSKAAQLTIEFLPDDPLGQRARIIEVFQELINRPEVKTPKPLGKIESEEPGAWAFRIIKRRSFQWVEVNHQRRLL